MSILKGVFLDGSIAGLNYTTQTMEDETTAAGEFTYRHGETVTFYAGRIFLGSSPGKARITPADLVLEVDGDVRKISHYRVTNIARFVMSLGKITDDTRKVLDEYRYRMNFVLQPEAFGRHPSVTEIMGRLGKKLISEHRARNLLRRTMNGIIKEADVKIPTKDGSYVLADLFRPLGAGKYPVVMCMGAWGKAAICGSVCTEEDALRHEKAEDLYFESYGSEETKKFLFDTFFNRLGACFDTVMPIPRLEKSAAAPSPADMLPLLVPVSETFEQINSMDWVPYGYAVLVVEERGMGANPGTLKQFGRQNAEDYCAAVEWAASQPWSSGKVGLLGASYYAMTQYLVAQRKPKGLAAMLPLMGDWDSYRDYTYSGGGLYNRADGMDLADRPQKETWMTSALENPFWSPEAYGPDAEYLSSCDIGKIDLPFWSAVEPGASLHGRGSSEAFIQAPSKNKKLRIIHEVGIHYWMFGPGVIREHREFFDHWLKGIDNGIMETPAVSMQIRTGDGGYHLRYAEDWPVPGTRYLKLYPDTKPADLTESGARKNLMQLSFEPPARDDSVSYCADVNRSEKETNNGVTFITAPLEEDLELAGYIKAGLFVSSSTKDMELHISVRALDENNVPVIYSPSTSICRYLPLGFGALKVSHRKKDEALSTEYRPVFTHLEEDCQPLSPGEIVACEVPTFPTTGLIRKGWRIRLDIEPVGNIWVGLDEETYRQDAVNTLHVGPTHLSYLQLPVLPRNSR